MEPCKAPKNNAATLVGRFGSSSHHPEVSKEKGKVPEWSSPWFSLPVLCGHQPRPWGIPTLPVLVRASPLNEQTSSLSEGLFVFPHSHVNLIQNLSCL